MKNNNWLKDNGYSKEEEERIYNYQLQDILNNTRWYLDNIHFLKEYKVSWICYSRTKRNIYK